MAWNSEPEVSALRNYAKRFKQTKIILISVDEHTNKFGIISYGETKVKCLEVKKTSDKIHDLIMNGAIQF